VRPGLIVGPHDGSDRFGYWVARFLRPGVLGDRPKDAIAPAPPSRPVQFIDGRDLADWMVDAAAARIKGTFNTSSPPRMWTMGSLVDALVERARATQTGIVPRWIDDATLLPMASSRGRGCRCGCRAPTRNRRASWSSRPRAIAQGLSFRPLRQTIDDTAAWLDTREAPNAWRNVLTADKEREILAQK
jgi:2'-hydroxyisoflavone reductase